MNQLLFFMKQLHRFSGPVIYANQIGMALMSLLQGFSIFLIIPLISVTGLFSLHTQMKIPLPILDNWFHHFSPDVNLIIILGIYVLIMISQNIFQNNQTLLNVKLQQRFIRHLKETNYKLILESDWRFFIRKRKSDLINIMLMEIGRVGAGTSFCLQFISSVIFTLVQIGIAFFISTRMTLFVVLFGGILLLFSKSFIRKSNDLGEETVELSRNYLSGVTDQLNGIKDIKSNSLEHAYINWLKVVNSKIERNIVNIIRVKNSSQLIYKCSSSLLIVIFIYLSITLFKAQPTQLMLVLVLFSRLWPRITTIQSNLEQLSSNIPSFNLLLQLERECKEAKEIKNNDKQLDELGSTELKELNRGLECKNVCFSYEMGDNNYALKNINVTIPANQMTAIVGRSGAGKSTLIDLLMGLNRPQTGAILIDGEPLNDQNLLGLRRAISYVPQDPFVFNSSIRENLTIVNPDATDDEIWEALEFAAADQFVNKSPQKLETLIGDRGIKLSGGERQRLVLARAILKQPSILILDEATSALDTENESAIQEALEKIRGKMTLIVIAHRLSTIRNADQVIVLDEGRVVQQGRYLQLARDQRGLFGQLLAKQMPTIS